jgi:glucosamine-6-phosphate deaminase
MEPIKTLIYDQLPVAIYRTNQDLGRAAALQARRLINEAISTKGEANIILATGNSQLTFLTALRSRPELDWSKVRIFHMDEYLGLDPQHPASFPLFLRRHFLDFIGPKAFYPIPSQPPDVDQACRDYTTLLKTYPTDMVAMGWGENGHIAFNDPPYALFNDPAWVKVVQLAEASRRQQVGEGHFRTLAEVPTQAITLTIPALLAPRAILCIVPEARKAEAVRACLTEPVSEERPGSILRQVSHARLYLDEESAGLLK